VRWLGVLALLLLACCAEQGPQLHGYPTEAACLADLEHYDSLPLPDFIKRHLISRDSLIVKETALYPCGEAVTVYRQEWEYYYGPKAKHPPP
jgi:hypothetical protein